MYVHGSVTPSAITPPLCLIAVSLDLDPAVVEPNNAIVVAQGEDLEATCNALSSLKTNTAWFKVTYTNIVQCLKID